MLVVLLLGDQTIRITDTGESKRLNVRVAELSQLIKYNKANKAYQYYTNYTK